MRSPKITLITSGLGAGGSELQLMQLAIGLQRRGWQARVISLQAGGVFHGRLVAAGIPVLESPVGRVAEPLALARLVRQLRAVRPCLVQTQAVRANLWGRIAAFACRLPVVASVRATYSYLPRAYYPLERLLARPTAAIVTPSAATSRYLVHPIGIDPRKVVTIPNGVDCELFLPRRNGAPFRSDWNLHGSTVVIAPGRLAPQKNYPGLLRAFALLADRVPDVALVIAGAGPLEQALRLQAHAIESRHHGMARIVFTGELDRDAMAGALAAADIVCLFSDFEGAPNVLLEAMAVGRPVVATGVDGVPELVQHGQQGLLVPRGDVHAAARALEQLARSPGLRARLGAAGRTKVEAQHSIEANVERHVQLYERVLERAAGARGVGVLRASGRAG